MVSSRDVWGRQKEVVSVCGIGGSLGQGELDLGLLRIIKGSGWEGPIGLLNHTDADAEVRLKDNPAGLDWLVGQLNGEVASPRPLPLSWKRGP